ncbi:hypothetical protein HQ865_22685 [Mucilaginibacter mali]|uniref:Uncharacterized protein n=1 Tax=Mucilaginibacter mali TaxID=2740462 RepID=A0A7D4QWR6_9SPHI|nr:hypothetical protein [Mucilaginibacter mali]QKJ32449.1 hypothetical protein HQ865_22685 [Mucilaginibacter mali]
MNPIRSNIYTPNEITLAQSLAESLDDQKSLAFYLSCAKKYPREYLLSTLAHVMTLPDHSVRTTRARLFTNIVTRSVFNTNDRTWD